MKQIKPDKSKEFEEKSREELKRSEREAMKQALEDFRQSSAYPYVMKFFKEQEEYIIGEIERIQNEEMKNVFMLPATKQREKISEMSKRNSVMTAVLAILKSVKGKL